jgi:hypothetical protein
MQASTAARASRAASSVRCNLTARRMCRWSLSRLNKASCAASAPVASSRGQGSRMTSLAAFRRTMGPSVQIWTGQDAAQEYPCDPAQAD